MRLTRSSLQDLASSLWFAGATPPVHPSFIPLFLEHTRNVLPQLSLKCRLRPRPSPFLVHADLDSDWFESCVGRTLAFGGCVSRNMKHGWLALKAHWWRFWSPLRPHPEVPHVVSVCPGLRRSLARVPLRSHVPATSATVGVHHRQVV